MDYLKMLSVILDPLSGHKCSSVGEEFILDHLAAANMQLKQTFVLFVYCEVFFQYAIFYKQSFDLKYKYLNVILI